MGDRRKAQPACGGRAVGNTVDAGCVDSAFDHPYYNTGSALCQKEIKAALRIGDKLPPGFDGPAKELAPANLGDGQFVHLVAS